MSNTFQDMHKINELSQELIKYLERFKDWIGGEISYDNYLETSNLRSLIDDNAEYDQAVWELEPHHLQEDYDKAKQAIQLLKQLTIRKE